ncbi:hypothetical protein BOX15_Mlig009507g2, partial [Macrostomum lignano]
RSGKEKQQKEKQSLPASSAQEGKSAAQLRAERRELQERQRAAKLQKQQEQKQAGGGKGGSKTSNPSNKAEAGSKKSAEQKQSAPIPTSADKKAQSSKLAPPGDTHQQQQQAANKKKSPPPQQQQQPADSSVKSLPSFFRHLKPPMDAEQITSSVYNEQFAQSQIEAAFVQLSLMVAHEQLQGPAARCLGLARALRQLLCTVPVQDLPRLIKPKLDPNMRLLRSAKPPTVLESYLEQRLANWVQSAGSSAENSDHWLVDRMNEFVIEQIEKARVTMRASLKSKINNLDCIMLYKPSSLIFECLEDIVSEGTKMPDVRIILLDSPPSWEGQAFLRRLQGHRLLSKCPVRYAMLSAAPSLLSDTSKLVLEGQALTANGNVLAPVGTAYLANVAWSHRIPCLVLCHACQTWDQVLIDSVSYNELGRVSSDSQLCNIQYDLTPGDLVTALITERGILPCTGSPVPSH